MASKYEIDKVRLQKYLPQLRGCAGLSAEALGQKIGVSKQAVNYIEKHLEKPISKMQYICIRAIFDEECCKNPNNLNLRDCYDLVFSDVEFYEENKARIEYAMHQAVEDTKIQKRKNRAEAKKKNSEKAFVTASSLAGTTAATLGIGGVAAATFPLMFSAVGVAVALGAANIKKNAKKQEENISKSERASSMIHHTDWLSEVFDAVENADAF